VYKLPSKLSLNTCIAHLRSAAPLILPTQLTDNVLGA